MAPINLPDGTEVSEVVLPDGTTAGEVIAPDGRTVFGGIPDSVVLDADATKVSSVDPTWADQSGNGNDLSAIGDPNLNGSINGTQAALLDGTDDGFEIDPFSQSLPIEVFVVARLDDLSTRADILTAPGASSDQALYYDGSDSFNFFAGSVVSGPSADLNPHIFDIVIRNGSDQLFFDGTSQFDANGGDRPPTRLTVGIGQNRATNPFDGPIGRVLYSVGELTQSERDRVTQTLADQFGIAL